MAKSTRGDGATAGTRPLGCRRTDVSLLLHLVRRHPDPRRPGTGDPRDRDLQPGGAALRPPGSRGSVVAPTRRRRPRPGRGQRPRGSGRRRGHPGRRARRAPAGAWARADRPRLRAHRRRIRARAPARRTRPPFARQLGRALPRDAGAARRAVAGGGLLRCLRERCRPDRARRRRPRRRHPGEAADRPRRRARPAAARSIRGDARLRLPDRVRRVPGRLPIVVVAGSRRTVARRGTVRRAHRHARAEVDRSKAA